MQHESSELRAIACFVELALHDSHAVFGGQDGHVDIEVGIEAPLESRPDLGPPPRDLHDHLRRAESDDRPHVIQPAINDRHGRLPRRGDSAFHGGQLPSPLE